jgi:ribose 5-phosphate isomerase B
MAKMHNNANFLAFGGRVSYAVPIEEMVRKFMETEFEGPGRHERRVRKIMELEV